MPTALLAPGILAAATLGLGLLFLLRPDRMVQYQERYAERFATVGPEDNPSYYEQTRGDRRETFQLGGLVLSLVGSGLLVFVLYGALFA